MQIYIYTYIINANIWQYENNQFICLIKHNGDCGIKRLASHTNEEFKDRTPIPGIRSKKKLRINFIKSNNVTFNQ